MNVLPRRYNDGMLTAAMLAAATLAALYVLLPEHHVSAALQALRGEQFDGYGWYKIGGYFALALAAVAAWFGYVYGSDPGPAEVHVDGPQLLNGKAGVIALQTVERKLMSKAQRAQRVRGLKIGGVEFSRTREVGHFNIVGLPGAGKTVLLNDVVLQVFDRGDRAIIHDPKGDFTAWLPVNKSRNFVIFGPWDSRSCWWDVADDVSTPALADTFARGMFPGTDFWDIAAREVFAGILKYVQRTHAPHARGAQKWWFDTIADIVGAGADNAIACAKKGDPNISLLIKDAAKEGAENKTADSIMATLSAGIGWIAAYAYAFDVREPDGTLKRNGFSIVRWLKNRNSRVYALVLKNDARFGARAEQIYSVLMAAASSYMNGSEMPEIGADDQGLWVILDEYPQLGKALAAEVQKIEELGRSRGIRVIKAMQDESQLYEIHGREKGRAQKSVQQTRIYAKTALETANEVARSFGNRTVQRASVSLTAQDGGAVSIAQCEVPVLRPEDLAGLEVIKEGPEKSRGVELIVNIDSTLAKVVQTFVPRERTRDVRAKVIDSQKWAFGMFEYAAKVEAEKAAKKADGEKAQAGAQSEAVTSFDQLTSNKQVTTDFENIIADMTE